MNEPIFQLLSRDDVWGIGLSVAAFLTLFWIVRGAPLGQSTPDEPPESPPRGFRDRAVALVVIGFLANVIAAYVAVTVGIPWALPLFGVGFGLTLFLIKKYEPYRHVSPTLRRVTQFANSSLNASVGAGILIVLNVVAFRYGGDPIDFTQDRSFSLSSLSQAQVKSLEKPLRFTIFLGRGDRAGRRLDRVRQLLDLFQASNPTKVTIETLDPFSQIGEFESFLKRIPDAAILNEGGVALEYGEGEGASKAVVSTQELFQVEGATVTPGKDSFQSTFKGEDVITSALIRLRDGKVSRVAFTIGHGEPFDEDPEKRGARLTAWKTRLGSVGLAPFPLNLTSDDVPADVELLVIASPAAPFQGPEIERLRAFMVRGGRVLMILGMAETTGLEDLLKTHNIIVENKHIYDPRFNLRGPNIVATPPIRPTAHPAVDAIVGQQVLIPNPRPINVLGTVRKRGEKPSEKANPGVDAMPILYTSSESFAIDAPRIAKPDPAKDHIGPSVVGVAAMNMPESSGQALGTPLLMVYSSPYIADNQFLMTAPANLDLLMNSINWLRKRPDLAGIAPKTHVSLLFTADPTLRMRLHTVPTLIAGLAVIGLGVLTYLTRRQ